MPSFKYVIELSEQDRCELLDIVTKGTNSARKILRAIILLASDKRKVYDGCRDCRNLSYYTHNCSDCENILLRKRSFCHY